MFLNIHRNQMIIKILLSYTQVHCDRSFSKLKNKIKIINKSKAIRTSYYLLALKMTKIPVLE